MATMAGPKLPGGNDPRLASSDEARREDETNLCFDEDD
jgi:hypothetical protein